MNQLKRKLFGFCFILFGFAATSVAQSTFAVVDSESVPGASGNMVVIERGNKISKP